MNYDISYKDYKKKNDIHGTVLYPAVMVAPVQEQIISKLIERNSFYTVLDPFHGSGTSLYVFSKLSPTIKLIGCDINPLANLITRVKFDGTDCTIHNDIQSLKTDIMSQESVSNYHYNNIEKWFRTDIIQSLSKIRYGIQKINNDTNRRFFWCMFSDIIRKYSNSRSSTYKLHIKTPTQIDSMKNKVIQDFIVAIESNVKYYSRISNNYDLIKKDSVDFLKTLDENSIDITITSPPYGDNKTTVPYGQYSSLALYWIDKKDLILEGWELDNYSSIDSKSLGGNKSSKITDSYSYQLLTPYLDQINVKKHLKVISFMKDYYDVLCDIARVTDKYIVITLGNRTVDGVNINLTDITVQYLENKNFILEDIYERDIPKKRVPKNICKEFVIVMKKVSTNFV